MMIASTAGETDLNCDWNVIFVEDHETFSQLMYDFSGKNGTNTIGLAQYHNKMIYISQEYKDAIDWWGMTVLEHEVKHAYLYETWVAKGKQGVCPCHFHP